MYKHNDLRMQRFGRLLVLSEAGRTNCRHILWLCKCDCGTEVVVSGNQLVSGKRNRAAAISGKEQAKVVKNTELAETIQP